MYKPKRRNKAPEQATKNLILKWIRFYPSKGFAWPNDSVGIWDQEKQCYRRKTSPFFIRGVSDIVGIWMGRPLFIEVKSSTGRLSEHQAQFLSRVRRYGGIAIVARSLQDVTSVLEKITTLPGVTPLNDPPLVLGGEAEVIV